MKMLHSTLSKPVINHRCVRFILAIVGIVIAVLCTIAFLEDIQTAKTFNANSSLLKGILKFGDVDFVSKAMTWL
jgi:hypothetical protein